MATPFIMSDTKPKYISFQDGTLMMAEGSSLLEQGGLLGQEEEKGKEGGGGAVLTTADGNIITAGEGDVLLDADGNVLTDEDGNILTTADIGKLGGGCEMVGEEEQVTGVIIELLNKFMRGYIGKAEMPSSNNLHCSNHPQISKYFKM